jgi:DNA repair protein RadC
MKSYLKITEWAPEDRPREKLITKGRSNLTDTEVLAIIIGSGTRARSALDVSKDLLSSVNYDLNHLAKLSYHDFLKIDGIGKAKAISIIASLELGRRRNFTFKDEPAVIKSSEQVYQLLKPELMDLNHEEFWLLLLNRGNRVIKKEKISSGGISGTVVDPKVVFTKCLESGASQLIMIHNHPSGNLKPSKADLNITEKIHRAGKFLEISLLDHIIFTDHAYLSFADEGLM